MRLLSMLLILTALLVSHGAQADEWNLKPDGTGEVCGGVSRDGRCYYVFTGTTDSGVIKVDSDFGNSFCLIADTATSGGLATVRIMRVVTSATLEGSIPVEGKVLTGVPPLACINDQPRGKYWIEVGTAPDEGSTAVLRVEGN